MSETVILRFVGRKKKYATMTSHSASELETAIVVIALLQATPDLRDAVMM